MRFGELRHSVQIQRATETRQANGGTTQAFATTATVWAAIEPLSGRESWIGEQIRAIASHKITMRWTAVSAGNRLLFGSRVFNIVVVVNVDERNHTALLAVSEAL